MKCPARADCERGARRAHRATNSYCTIPAYEVACIHADDKGPRVERIARREGGRYARGDAGASPSGARGRGREGGRYARRNEARAPRRRAAYVLATQDAVHIVKVACKVDVLQALGGGESLLNHEVDLGFQVVVIAIQVVDDAGRVQVRKREHRHDL